MNPNFFNLSKSKKRDILSDLVAGKSFEGIISKKELNAVNRLLEGPPSNNVPVKTNKQAAKIKKVIAARKKPIKTKKRTTHYLSQELSENLDKAQIAIRSRIPEDLRSKVSKSYIVNQALAMILQEFESKGKDSRLMRAIMQKL